MWMQQSQEILFYYHEIRFIVEGQLIGVNMPFTIGIKTPLQKVQMLWHGHTNSVYVDAIFGTNEKNVLILSWYWLSYISPMCCVNGEVHIIHRYRAHNEQK
jgi:hypothetical protein